MKRKKTHKEFVEELIKINPNIEVLEEYKGAHNKIEVRCLLDGYKWKVRPNYLLSGCGCPKCSGNKKHEQFIQAINKINPNIEVLGEYKGSITKIEVRCLVDGYKWYVIPGTILRGCGCPKCSGLKKKTHKEFVEELIKINSNIEVLGYYKNANTKIEVRCLVDGYKWYAVPNNLIRGHGCPVCNESKGEKKVEEYLKNNNYKYIPQYRIKECRNKIPLPFDFAVFKENKLLCLIEYQGVQHYEEREHFGGVEGFKYQQNNDVIKRNYCIVNNILLIEIPYWEKKVEEYLKERLLKIEELKEVNN